MARIRPKAVIFDIDGTLSSVAHRAGLVPEDWSRFHGSMILDAPIEHSVRKLKEHRAAGDKVLLLSMRPERFRPHTERWLRDHNIPYTQLFLRPELDYRSSDAAKLAIFQEQIEPNYDVAAAYDDREDVLAMWQALGVEGRKVHDPGLPPMEGLPAPDPKYPHGRPKLPEKLPVKVGAGGVGASGQTVYVPAHLRVKEGKVEHVRAYFRTLSAVERLASKIVKLARRDR